MCGPHPCDLRGGLTRVAGYREDTAAPLYLLHHLRGFEWIFVSGGMAGGPRMTTSWATKPRMAGGGWPGDWLTGSTKYPHTL